MLKWNWFAIYGLALFAVVVLFYPANDRLTALAPYVWPATAIIGAILFREPIARAIDRLRHIGPGGAKLAGTKQVSTPPVQQVANAVAGASIQFSAPARKLLATLGFYQVAHFQDDRTRRWWMKVPRRSPDFAEFEVAAKELQQAGMIVVELSGETYISDRGLDYYKAQQSELNKEPRYESFQGEK